VVPEGIIFQSGTAYKALRKMLVDTSLVAVVSLPAGVFNPYSGVKTSILFMDKRVHKQTDKVLFVKVQNDGFNLGAQRRAVVDSHLPEATRLLRNWMTGPTAFEGDGVMAQAVERKRIGASGDFNLSGERYLAALVHDTDWPLLPLSEIAEFRSGLWKGEREPLRTVKILRNTNFAKGGFLNLSDVAEHPVEERQLESRLLRFGDILLEKSGGGPTQPVGRVALFGLKDGEYSYSNFTARIRVVNDRANPLFVWLMLNALYQRGVTEGLQKQTSGIRNLDNPAYQALQIPLPPLEVQHQIVAEIKDYQKIIDGARQVLDSYKPLLVINPAWDTARLDELCNLVRGSSPRPQGDPKYFVGPVPRLMVADITRDGMLVTPAIDSLTEEGAKKSRPMSAGSVVMAVSGNPGLPAILQVDACIHDGFVGFRELNAQRLLPEFFYYVLLSNKEANKSQSVGAVFMNLTTDQIREFLIPLPDLSTQRAIVADIEAEQALVNANRELIRRMEAKVKAAIDRVWGE
jgi:type I restriction enzyme M protein